MIDQKFMAAKKCKAKKKCYSDEKMQKNGCGTLVVLLANGLKQQLPFAGIQIYVLSTLVEDTYGNSTRL